MAAFDAVSRGELAAAAAGVLRGGVRASPLLQALPSALLQALIVVAALLLPDLLHWAPAAHRAWALGLGVGLIAPELHNRACTGRLGAEANPGLGTCSHRFVLPRSSSIHFIILEIREHTYSVPLFLKRRFATEP